MTPPPPSRAVLQQRDSLIVFSLQTDFPLGRRLIANCQRLTANGSGMLLQFGRQGDESKGVSPRVQLPSYLTERHTEEVLEEAVLGPPPNATTGVGSPVVSHLGFRNALDGGPELHPNHVPAGPRAGGTTPVPSFPTSSLQVQPR